MRLLTTPLQALSRRRRSRFAPLMLLLLALGVTGGAYAAFAPSPQAAAATRPSDATIEEGHQLFLTNCSSCHGLNAEGTSIGPSLVGADAGGAASVDFQVGTGRMPAAQEGPQNQRKRGQFTQDEIDAMAAYIGTVGIGPPIPTEEDLDFTDADAARGGALYRTNCSMCHNFAGKGGALSRGRYAPSLTGVSAKHIYEAMQTGSQSMPLFADSTLPPKDKLAIIKYLKLTEEQSSPGGLALGKLGPVSEGAVGWLVGLGSLIGCAVWLGAKAR